MPATPVWSRRIRRGVRIPMRDGNHLSVDLYLPGGEGPWPVVIEYDPYRKDEVDSEISFYTRLPERGYIVALAKTNDLLMVYPPNAFNPSQNIVLDFTKGETFGVSRFREARATFPAAALTNRHPRFQILLFSTDGRVIANQHVEEQP